MELLKSEIKKAVRLANKVNKCKDATVTAYSISRNKDLPDFYDVTCEICHDYATRAENDVMISVFMPDRRMSFAYAIIDGDYVRLGR